MFLNPNHEIRNAKQILMTKIRITQRAGTDNIAIMGLFWSLEHWIFEFISNFDIRISYFTNGIKLNDASELSLKPGYLNPDLYLPILSIIDAARRGNMIS